MASSSYIDWIVRGRSVFTGLFAVSAIARSPTALRLSPGCFCNEIFACRYIVAGVRLRDGEKCLGKYNSTVCEFYG